MLTTPYPVNSLGAENIRWMLEFDLAVEDADPSQDKHRHVKLLLEHFPLEEKLWLRRRFGRISKEIQETEGIEPEGSSSNKIVFGNKYWTAVRRYVLDNWCPTTTYVRLYQDLRDVHRNEFFNNRDFSRRVQFLFHLCYRNTFDEEDERQVYMRGDPSYKFFNPSVKPWIDQVDEYVAIVEQND